jgi:hypothetical protein
MKKNGKKDIKRAVKNVGRKLVENPTRWYNLIVFTMENLSLRESSHVLGIIPYLKSLIDIPQWYYRSYDGVSLKN